MGALFTAFVADVVVVVLATAPANFQSRLDFFHSSRCYTRIYQLLQFAVELFLFPLLSFWCLRAISLWRLVGLQLVNPTALRALPEAVGVEGEGAICHSAVSVQTAAVVQSQESSNGGRS